MGLLAQVLIVDLDNPKIVGTSVLVMRLTLTLSSERTGSLALAAEMALLHTRRLP